MSTLDMELIFTDILPRLPVKSLLRFKCISKSFKFEITSRNFSQLHLRYHSLSSEDSLFILIGKRGMICYDLDLITTSISTSIPISMSTSTFKWIEYSIRGVGSCNGLICIKTRKYRNYFSVLNPTTRICQDICLLYGLETGNAGFAFDPVNLDYKIVCISFKTDTLITTVYSLNANTWTILEFPFPNVDMTTSSYDRGTLVNNNLLHWMFFVPSVGSLGTNRIGCFDVCKNEWTDDVLLPHCYHNRSDNNYLCEIGVINEKLCSSFKSYNGDKSCFEVWMMNEYGVQDSWVQLMTVHDPWPLPIARNRESGLLLIPRYHSPFYSWCDSLGNELNTVTFDGAEDVINKGHFTIIKYPTFICKKSFVHLPHGHLSLELI